MIIDNLFKPNYYFNSILDITDAIIHSLKIKVIILDIDNTIVPLDEKVIDNEFLKWIQYFSFRKIIILVSNNNNKRVKELRILQSIDYIVNAWKPFPFCFFGIFKKYKVKKDEVLIIGDQLFDDILGGNIVGIRTILVNPIKREKQLRIRIKRYFEYKILCKMGINK